ncbi:MAG TPA: phenylalanine--tRNA ligase subunit beta [Flavobacteriales bacterium]|nr:phenylalanine--tRNA ligase subunit beta [Flavobacteriales bacterium]
MKVAYNWLKEYADFNISVNRLSELLTDSGLEVEGVEKFQAIEGGLEGIVIGEVITCEKHPNADRLTVTTVDVGEADDLPIVCGAPNVAVGQKVAVARVGTILYPTKGEPFKIKRGKIRGEVSEGMICAEDEMGLGTDHDGILVLPDHAEIGKPLSTIYNVGEDWTIEIGLTPNRAESASHIGVCRDLIALSVVMDDLNVERINWPDVSNFAMDNYALPIQVVVENTEACPRYSGLTMTDIKVGPSPEWLQRKLRSIGLSPINNVVDISNFVMHESGQPLHIFDANAIKGNQVVIRTEKEGTKFTTLDEAERKLDADDLMICNAEEGMCIAGVFGGLTSGVTETTTNIFIESANFNPVWIRKAAKRHGLNTDASFRFERGVDPNLTIFALKRAALLIKEIAGGNISSEIVDVYPDPIPERELELSYEETDRIIGIEIDRLLLRKIIKALGIEIIGDDGNILKLKIPHYRVDVEREIDVIEEILRIYGYNNIPIPDQYRSSVNYLTGPDHESMLNKVSDHLTSLGFLECKANSLTSSKYYADSSVFSDSQTVKLKNPLSSDLDVMRQTLLFGLLEGITLNQNRQNPDLKLYEFGKVYWQDNGKTYEQNRLALAITGKRFSETWAVPHLDVSFSDLNGYARSILNLLNYGNLRMVEQSKTVDIYDKGFTENLNGKFLVHRGILKRDLLDHFDIRQDVYYAEINWDLFYTKAHNRQIKFNAPPKYPQVRRDLSLLINTNTTFSDIKKSIESVDNHLIKNIILFDVFEGKKLPEGKKSYGIGLVFQHPKKTLTDKQVDRVMVKITSQLEEKLGAELRK